ncbi:MAG: right-handed parallel beta-helix repeat-containing protein [Planctomycetaceae bacterium]|nr:right-handed parallel beta-helix repeat-containing protein [Planctomycetaceae bacterium]
MKIVRNLILRALGCRTPNSEKSANSQERRGRRRGAALLSAALLTLAGSAAEAQGPMTFGRSLFPNPSGAMTESVSANRNGFGMQFRGGHSTGPTVGRDDSLTYISLMPHINVDNSLFFGDSRIAFANQDGMVYSFGGGYRYFIPELDVVAGANGYFDNDNITGADFKQWSVGAELLAHRWEARGNLYRTQGNTSQLVGRRVDPTSAAFVGNNVQFTRVDTFAEALEGFDAEMGFLLPGDLMERFDVRAFGGAYLYQGENIDQFAGWSSRVQADVGRWLELGLKVTDDDNFNTTVSFTATVHFGGFQSQEHVRRSAIQRFREPVRRSLNVAATTSDTRLPGQIAVNPATGLPYDIVHVNSNDAIGPYLGTIDDPFRSLSTGLASGADVVFVHAGSQFNALPDNSVILSPGQQLMGEGLISTPNSDRIAENIINVQGVGDLQLPSSPTFIANSTLLRPMILNTGGTAVTLADNSQLSGFIIDGPTGIGVWSNGASDTIINDSLIQNTGLEGILLSNTIDSTTIRNTIISGATGPAFHVDGGTGGIGLLSTSTAVEDPAFGAIINSSQQAILVENMTGGSVSMQGYTVDDNGGSGVLISNNASNVSLDNMSLLNSISNGIAIQNSTGNYAIRNTLRGATTIDGAAQESVLISNLGAGGRVTFQDLVINNRNNTGISVQNLGGSVQFSEAVSINTPAGGTGPAISVTGSQSTGSVAFSKNVTITGSNESGVLISGNSAGSSVNFRSPVSLTNSLAEGVLINSDSGLASFETGLLINNRGAQGVSIQNSHGVYSFLGNTTIPNPLVSLQPAIDIQNSDAVSSFASVAITGAIGNPGGGAGIHLANNIAGGNTALITFNAIDVTSAAGVGVFGLNNTNVRINDGVVSTTAAAAVDLENTGMDITLESVSSIGSPDYGIRLVNNNSTGFKTFTVTGDPALGTFGSGGSILAAGLSGVLMQNGGQVTLQRMLFNDNNYGIFVANSGLAVDDDQFLHVYFSQIDASDIRAIETLNLMDLDIQDSTFNDNGDDAALGRETILAQYDELLNDPDTEFYNQFDNPYLVNIDRNTFISLSDDVILIQSQISAANSHIGIDLDTNNFTVSDTRDPDATDLQDDGVIVNWTGPMLARFQSNTFLLDGAAAQTAIDLQQFSTTDHTELAILGTQLNSTQLAAAPLQNRGFRVRSSSQSDILISANDLTFTGGEGLGMEFNLAGRTNMQILNNNITDQTDGGAGIIFNQVSAPSSFTINGNNIILFDLGVANEEGILFRSVGGVVNLFSTTNNLVTLGNPNTPNTRIETVFFMPAGSNNGQILVNGVPVP